MIIRTLDPHQYYRIRQEAPAGFPDFGNRSWIGAYGPKIGLYGVFENNVAVATFLLFSGGKWPLRSAITPPFAPHIALAVCDPTTSAARRSEMLAAVLDCLPGRDAVFYKVDLAPEWLLCMPEGIAYEVRRTYQLALTADEGELWQGLDSKTRNVIRKAEKSSYTLRYNGAPSEMLPWISRMLSNKGIRHSPEVLGNLLSQEDAASVFRVVAVCDGETEVWRGLGYISGKTMYYLFGYLNRDVSDNAAGAFGLYALIRLARAEGLETFDFEGSMVPSIQRFFESFGPRKVEYPSLTGGTTLGKWIFGLRQRQ